jgi:hypothetical protein
MSDAPDRVDMPVFSDRLDQVLGAMVKGEAPNVGRFCGYCYTPLSKKAESCSHCARMTAEVAPLASVPGDIIGLYRRMRRRESLIVNSFAFAGLALAVLLFIVLVGVAVYAFDQSLWMLAFATLVLLVGGRVFAGILGGWIGDSIGYDYAHRKLVSEWHELERDRPSGAAAATAGGTSRAPEAAPTARG